MSFETAAQALRKSARRAHAVKAAHGGAEAKIEELADATAEIAVALADLAEGLSQLEMAISNLQLDVSAIECGAIEES